METLDESNQGVLKLANILSLSVLTTEEDFTLAHADIYEECSKYGKVVRLELPRPNHLQMQLVYEQQFSPQSGRYVLNEGASFAYV